MQLSANRSCFVVVALAGTLASPFSSEVCGASGNATPYLSQPFNQFHSVGQNVALQLNGGDPSGEPVVYTASGLPNGLVLAANTGLISGVPTTAGAFFVTVS